MSDLFQDRVPDSYAEAVFARHGFGKLAHLSGVDETFAEIA